MTEEERELLNAIYDRNEVLKKINEIQKKRADAMDALHECENELEAIEEYYKIVNDKVQKAMNKL